MMLGGLYLGKWSPRAAEAFYVRLVTVRPRETQVKMGSSGKPLKNEGRSADAEGSHRKAIEVEPADWRTHNALGVSPVLRGRYRGVGRRVPRRPSFPWVMCWR